MGSQGTSALTSEAGYTCVIQNNTIVLANGHALVRSQNHNNGKDCSYQISGNEVSAVNGTSPLFQLPNFNGGPALGQGNFVDSIVLSSNTMGSGVTQVADDFGGTAYIGSVSTQ